MLRATVRFVLFTAAIGALALPAGAEPGPKGAPRERLEDRARQPQEEAAQGTGGPRRADEGGDPVIKPNSGGRRGSGDGGSLIFAGLSYDVLATAPRLNRRVLGPVTDSVQGIAAAPVDSFVYDGVGSVPVDGSLILQLDPSNNLGVVQASWTDPDGNDWVYTQRRFAGAQQLSGVRFGASVTEVESILDDGVALNVFLFGDTGAGPAVLPTLYSHIAARGPAEIRLNGQPFVNPYGPPGPSWIGEVMVCEGVRQKDGSVRTQSNGIFDPANPASGAVIGGDLEVHLMFHDQALPLTASVPPEFSFFYHVVFEDVQIQIVEAGGRYEVEGPSSGTR